MAGSSGSLYTDYPAAWESSAVIPMSASWKQHVAAPCRQLPDSPSGQPTFSRATASQRFDRQPATHCRGWMKMEADIRGTRH